MLYGYSWNFNCTHEVGGRAQLKFQLYPYSIQGGSDISGTLSKLHCSIKTSSFLLILSQ
jgi:hypothetical protein